jgi:succinate dehydrogenase / fumarate reductase, flavoprotein subunit
MARGMGAQGAGAQGAGATGATEQGPAALTDGRYETHEYDVVVIGAGGAGLRAAIEASARGARTALVCKSLLGKAHTVMAEGGIAAALGNVYPEDNWRVHFRDTMRGGKLLNHWRMAQLHAQEAPERVLELEEWGALFDRTRDGLILQRDFGGHRYARLAHVGDRTGLEMIRTLQQHAVHRGIDVFMECTVQHLLRDGGRIAGAFGYWRESGRFVLFRCKAVVLATGGIGKCWRITSNSWEYTGDGIAMALDAGADLIDMEMVQFHPTGMVWPPSVRGILVTEGVRGDGGTLRNAGGERFMFGYVTDYFRAETAETEAEADAWYEDKVNNRRTPDLLPRDEVARAINAEVKAGRGSPHGGVFLDIASRRDADYVKRRLPSMYHQFLELAGVDITRESMEVGPTCHYVMGGVRVDPDSAATAVDGLFAAGEVAAGLHGANRLGGNSLSDLLVFGRRAGLSGAEYASRLPRLPAVDAGEVEGAARAMLVPFGEGGGAGGGAGAGAGIGEENPYAIHADLQDCMQNLVGIIRTEGELLAALERIGQLKARAARVRVTGNRHYNPAWHLALDLPTMLTVSEACARSALLRKESRGGHTREDFPQTDPQLGRVNVVTRRAADGGLALSQEPLPEMPAELQRLIEEAS